MKIGIVGNRKGWDCDFVINKLKELKITKEDIIVSGGASGVDSFAQCYAKMIGAEFHIFYPDPNEQIPDRYFNRNKKIARYIDKLIAFDKKRKSGTYNTIRKANDFGKQVIVICNKN